MTLPAGSLNLGRPLKASFSFQFAQIATLIMTTKEKAIQITKDNLLLVFGEDSTPKRLEKISELYAPSSEVFLADPWAISKTHEGISNIVTKVKSQSPGYVVSEIGECFCIDLERQGGYERKLTNPQVMSTC